MRTAFLLLIMSINGLAICQTITFEKKLNYGATETGVKILPTDDGYLAIGAQSIAIGYTLGLAVKLDTAGNVVWSKTYGPANSTSFKSGFEVADGFYLVGSTYDLLTNDYDIYILKISNTGDSLWSKQIRWPNRENVEAVAKSDSAFAIVGYTTSYSIGGDADAYILKMKLSGDSVCATVWGGSKIDVPTDIISLDTIYYVGGYTFSSTNHKGDFFLLKITSQGKLLWSKEYGTTESEMNPSFARLSDTTFIISGGSSYLYPNYSAYHLIVDTAGSIIKSKISAGPPDKNFLDVTAAGDKIAGTGIFYNGTDYDGYIMGLDTNLDSLWQRDFAGPDSDAFYDIEPTSDGGYILTGRSQTNCFACLWVMKTDSLGCIIPGCDTIKSGLSLASLQLFDFTLFPNPAKSTINIKLQSPTGSGIPFKIFNLQGQELRKGIVEDHITSLDISTLPAGPYLLVIETAGKSVVKQFLVE